MDHHAPFVRAVVLNFDGGQMTIDCIESILASDWPADRLEIVLVDNGSLDDVAERVRNEFPQVRLIEPLANTGFAGGCNLGITAPGEFDLIALVNNDATVAPGWLAPLVAALDSDDRLGAACPKMLFEGRYQEVDVSVEGAETHGSDPRSLGVRVSALRIDGERAEERVVFDEGWHGPEAPYAPDDEEIARWSSAAGRIRVRSNGEPARSLSLRVAAVGTRRLHMSTAVGTVDEKVDSTPVWVDIELEPDRFDVINNAGSNLYQGGFGGDRGFLERDHGQYDTPADVFAWCGGAVLLRRAYLDDVGLFDESLFLYYEDTDLSWRGRLRGWGYRYIPESVIRHRHAASSGVGSAGFRYYTERNRLLVLAKNAPARLAWRAGLGEVRRLARAIGRDLVLRPFTLRLPVRAEVAHRRRVLSGYLHGLPAAIRHRRTTGSAAGRRELMHWAVSK